MTALSTEQKYQFRKATGRDHYSTTAEEKKMFDGIDVPRDPMDATSVQRVNAGMGTRADSISTGLLPRASAQSQPSQWEQSYGRIYGNMGTPTKADSINVGLLPRAAAQNEPAPMYRNIDGVPYRIDPSTNQAMPVTTPGGSPLVPKKKDDVVSDTDYRSALTDMQRLSQPKQIRGGDLNWLSEGATDSTLTNVRNLRPDSTYAADIQFERARETVAKYEDQQAMSEMESMYPPAQHTGKMAQDTKTGAWYYSDGKAWRKIVNQ